MVQQQSQERRDSIRAKRIMSIQYRRLASGKRKVHEPWKLSTTHDMSVGGLAFYTDEEYQPGDVLELRVVMSGILDIFDGMAQVVRMEKKRMGSYYLAAVKFLEKNPRPRRAKSYSAKSASPKTKNRIRKPAFQHSAAPK